MILDPLASHPISAFCASFLNKRPTPSECGASSSSCPEYNINSPVVNRSCPDWVHRVSQSPSTVRLNISISAVTWAVFPLRTLFARSKCRCSKFSWSKEGQLALWLPFGFHRNTSYVVFFTRWGCWPHARPSSFLKPGLGLSMAELDFEDADSLLSVWRITAEYETLRKAEPRKAPLEKHCMTQQTMKHYRHIYYLTQT